MSLRTAGTVENPLYCIKDICAILGIKNHSDKGRVLDAGEYKEIPMLDTLGRTQSMKFCTKRGVVKILSSIHGHFLFAHEKCILQNIKDAAEYMRNRKKPRGKGFVYLLRNKTGDIAKVGKADNCRARWKSYQCPFNWVPVAAYRVEKQTESEAKIIGFMRDNFTLACGREFFWCSNTTPVQKYMTTTFGENILHEI